VAGAGAKPDLLSKWNGKPSKKGTGFDQLASHQTIEHECVGTKKSD